MEIKEFYQQSLGIGHPWVVSEVAFLPEHRAVEVRVRCAERVLWADPDTGQKATIHDWRQRKWRHLDTCEYETWVVAEVPRVKLDSGKVETVRVPWAEQHGRFTIAMERQIIDILRDCPAVLRAAKIAGISRDQAQGVMDRAVKRGLERRELEPLQLIGIDEKALRKRHKYATIITDLVSGCVVEISETRTLEATTQLLEELPRQATESIEAVAMDMWPAYISAVEKTLPEAAIVFDKFHIKMHLNDGVDKVRRAEHKELSAAGNMALKGMKYQFLKRHEDLRRKSAREFREVLKQNLNTGLAWGLKETFDCFWEYRSVSGAMRFFYNWLESVDDSELGPMMKVGEMLKRHLSGILNYISYPITNASAEGLNSMIQMLRSAARGLPRFDSFRVRVLFHFGGLSLHPA
jgi:transposase